MRPRIEAPVEGVRRRGRKRGERRGGEGGAGGERKGGEEGRGESGGGEGGEEEEDIMSVIRRRKIVDLKRREMMASHGPPNRIPAGGNRPHHIFDTTTWLTHAVCVRGEEDWS